MTILELLRIDSPLSIPEMAERLGRPVDQVGPHVWAMEAVDHIRIAIRVRDRPDRPPLPLWELTRLGRLEFAAQQHQHREWLARTLGQARSYNPKG